MKKILFVINTLGCGGAENALISLLNVLDDREYEISLYVLMNQGELIDRIPENVKILNTSYSNISVQSKAGVKVLKKYILRTMFGHGSFIKNLGYLLKNIIAMKKKGAIKPDKLLWRIMSDGGVRYTEQYDLAVAYLEGGSTYYVADQVKAAKKVAFIHTDYRQAGYTRKLDKGCYECYDRLFAVSDESRNAFLSVYPEYEKKIEVFHNIVDQKLIRKKALEKGGFEDDYAGIRILTVGRLTKEKAIEVSVDAMHLLKEKGYRARWYVIGEGDQRTFLENRIRKYGLEKDFILLGAKDNPCPYYAQTDIYVHASRYEGKSIAIQEAKTLGSPMLVSDCQGNREQITDGVNGKMCDFNAESICQGVAWLMDNEEERKRLGETASKELIDNEEAIKKFLELL